MFHRLRRIAIVLMTGAAIAVASAASQPAAAAVLAAISAPAGSAVVTAAPQAAAATNCDDMVLKRHQ
jgi:hypothetical protein